MENIKAGYQLNVTTWEGDADSYKTKTLSGLTEEDVKFYVAWGTQFYSRNNQLYKKGLGNGGNTEQEIIDTFYKALSVCRPTSPEILSTVEDIESYRERQEKQANYIHEVLVDDLLNYTESYYDYAYFTRVFDSFQVFYFPTDIENVTNKFKGE